MTSTLVTSGRVKKRLFSEVRGERRCLFNIGAGTISVHAPYDSCYKGFVKSEACENCTVTNAILQLSPPERSLGRWEAQKCSCLSKAADRSRTTPQVCSVPW